MGGSPRFVEQTAVEAVDDEAGRYRGFLSEDWNCPIIPHGGVATAVALRAMTAALDAPEQRLRTSTTVYVAPVRPGPVEIDVELLRRGRSMSQLSATLRNVDAPTGHTTIAVFGGPRQGFEFTELEMPSAPPPEECRSWDDAPDELPPRLKFNFWDHVTSRMARGHFPWDEYEPATSERVYWYRFNEAPYADGIIDPLSVVALCDTMPGAVMELVGPGGPSWLPPSADLTVHLFADTTSEWVLAHNHARHAGDGYASVEIDLWDPVERVLLASASQVMFFTFPETPA